MAVGLISRNQSKLDDLVGQLAESEITAAGAPGEDHEPGDIAEVLWKHHTERNGFQTRIGIADPA